jgi:hypothetical protein
MNSENDNVGKVESFSTIVVNIGTILSWIFTFFTAFVLTSQPQPISLPGILELGGSYKLIFLVSIFLAYIQVLRRSWANQKRSSNDVEATFGGYLYGSTIKAKRPLVLIGFVSTLGIIFVLIFTELFALAIIVVFVGIVAIGIFVNDAEAWGYLKRNYDDEFRKRWLKRIKNQLHQDGRAHSLDFTNLPSVTRDEINWAIKLYFELYEFEQDLIFTKRTVEKNSRTYLQYEIRFEHVPSRMPNR